MTANTGPMSLVGGPLEEYQLLRKLGAGGAGDVYEAVHKEQPERKLAIKIFKQHAAKDAKHSARFVREAKIAMALTHPAIVRVYDYVQPPFANPYLVMERVDGVLLRDLMDQPENPLALKQVLNIFRQLADAVAYAHQQGVIHRDLKPSNIIIEFKNEQPVVKILDFGIAKATGLDFTDIGTEDNVTLGTYEYMAPEQFESAALVDGRADVYSLGIMLYASLCGQLPFRADEELPRSQLAAYYARMHTLVKPRPLPASAPGPLIELAGAMLAKSAAARPTMGAVYQRLVALEQQRMAGAAGLDAAWSLSPTGQTSGAGAHACVRPSPSRVRLWALLAIIGFIWAMAATAALILR